jgi:two-component system chemotaxis response regulator CheY
VQREPPDVIVLDVLFPEGSALEFLRQLRQEERLRNCPVLVCSAVAEREAVLQLAREGIQGWLIKPFSISEAQQRLLRLLGAHQSDSAQQMQPTPQP